MVAFYRGFDRRLQLNNSKCVLLTRVLEFKSLVLRYLYQAKVFQA